MKKGLDKVDRKILSIFQDDSRKTYAEVAKECKLSETAIRNRMKKLVEKGVIKKFTVALDAEKIGRPISAILCVNIGGEVGPVAASKLVNFDEVIDIYTVTGEFDLILRAVCRDIRHLEQVIEKIRALDFINGTRTFVILNKIKEASKISL